MHRNAPRLYTEKVRSKSAAAVFARVGLFLVDHAGVGYGDVSLDGHGAASARVGLRIPGRAV
uniref:Uncharacterized protein n=1 Tax=Oryza punctata TaxID=4537 RepID=A0A0E0LHL0_ORYPU